jgi:hypothetical protein
METEIETETDLRGRQGNSALQRMSSVRVCCGDVAALCSCLSFVFLAVVGWFVGKGEKVMETISADSGDCVYAVIRHNRRWACC